MRLPPETLFYLAVHISAVDQMDNLTQRRIIAVTGIIIAFLGLTSFLWGMLKNDTIFQLMGFFFIIIAYVTTVIVKKMREKDQAEKGILKKD